MRFAKPALTLDEQVDQLIGRGMRIDDRSRACHYLRHINYYRLTGYWLPFEADHGIHAFHAGTSFDDVLNLYVFDRGLRLLLLDAIERVEVSVRANWAYHMAHAHGPHAYLEPAHSVRRDWHAGNLDKLLKTVKRSDEVFIEHYRKTYSEPPSPPIWAVCEVMSLGQLSRWIRQLSKKDRGAIAKPFGLDQSVFGAFVHHITYIRNLCAHHNRVWNRSMTVTMQLPRSKPKHLSQQVNPRASRKIYNTLTLLAHWLEVCSPGHSWVERLLALIDEHAIDTAQMGFPSGYRGLPLWMRDNQAAPGQKND